MASVWGKSWGKAWDAAWGTVDAVIATPAQPTIGIGGGAGRRVRKRKVVLPSVRRDRDDDVLLFLLK